MAGGVAFDPNEFAAFKAQGAASKPASPAPTWNIPGEPVSAPPVASGGFDPAEFSAFKAQKTGGPQGGDPGALQLRVGSRPSPEPAPASFDDRFGDGPMARAIDTSTPLGAGLQRTADERLVGKPDGSTPALAALYRAGNTVGLNLPRNVAAGIATGLGALGASGYSPRSFSENYDLAKDQEEAFARQAPKSALAGTVGGVVAGAVALPAFRAAEGASLGTRALANLGTGFGYGAATELFDTKDGLDALKGGAIGGVLGAGGGYAVDKLAPHVMAGLNKVAPAFTQMIGRGVPVATPQGGFTAEAETVLREIGLDPSTLPPDLATQMQAAFRTKGATSAVAREAAASEFAIPLSRGQSTLDPRALDLEGAALGGNRGGRAQEIGRGFETRQAGAIDAARSQLQGMAARGEPLIDNPTAAFEAVADRARSAGTAATARSVAAQAEQDAALRAVQGASPVDALDGATAAVSGVREAAGRARGAYGQAYDDVGAIEGTFAPGALSRTGERVRGMLGAETPVSASVTPAAAQALAMLDDIPRTLGLRPGEEPTAQQVVALRKGLSSLYGSTSQNGTDRHALGEVVNAFDRHLEDMFAIGQFRRGLAVAPTAPGRAAEAAGDLAPPVDAIPLPEAPGGSPETLTRYLARNGGIPLDDEARAADLNRLYVPGGGTLARRGAPTWDDLRVRLTEEGFLPYGEGETISPRDLADRVREMVRAERQGRPTYRMDDEARAGGGRAAERVSDQNADHLAMVDRQARRITIDMESYGLRPQDLDRAALNEAAERMVLGHADDAATAYEQAVARRGADAGEAGLPASRSADDAPFPEIGESVGPATSDALPIGDTGPADTMRKARGLFREYKQAFSPRGPGDVAGQRLQKIVERDASPNEAVSMLFGTTTGRVSSGQLQTLGRLREAVGSESETWRAVQQSIIGRYIGGEGRDLGTRLDYLLRGEGRALAAQFLDADQRQGLGRLRAALAQTDAARTAAPAWVADLERKGFDPNAIASSLFGSGVPGARPGSLNEAKAAKSFLGEASAEWAGVRQAAIQKITDPAMSAGKMVDRVRAFTDGPGSSVARELFDAAELGKLRRFASALQTTLRPDGTMKPGSGEGAKIVAKALDVLTGMVAFKVAGPAAGAAAYGARIGQRALIGGAGAAKARRSFEGGAPRLPAPPVDYRTDRLAVGSGVYSGS